MLSELFVPAIDYMLKEEHHLYCCKIDTFFSKGHQVKN